MVGGVRELILGASWIATGPLLYRDPFAREHDWWKYWRFRGGVQVSYKNRKIHTTSLKLGIT